MPAPRAHVEKHVRVLPAFTGHVLNVHTEVFSVPHRHTQHHAAHTQHNTHRHTQLNTESHHYITRRKRERERERETEREERERRQRNRERRRRKRRDKTREEIRRQDEKEEIRRQKREKREDKTRHVSKKNPSRTNYSSIFSSKVQNLTVFSIIYMIRIRFFGPRRINSETFFGRTVWLLPKSPDWDSDVHQTHKLVLLDGAAGPM